MDLDEFGSLDSGATLMDGFDDLIDSGDPPMSTQKKINSSNHQRAGLILDFRNFFIFLFNSFVHLFCSTNFTHSLFFCSFFVYSDSTSNNFSLILLLVGADLFIG